MVQFESARSQPGNFVMQDTFIAKRGERRQMAGRKLKDCPERPPCPKCGIAVFTIDRIDDGQDYEHCECECLRCGHIEVSEPAKIGSHWQAQRAT
jgi:hypothetical protein